ncbi:MAG TPA: efflux RND transporter periplasmic adaptor subunit [Chryseosolibacter sp.]|nr:efflux RND transporter periplasmic adaptor subunit [Chryseosolibacter sp.]
MRWLNPLIVLTVLSIAACESKKPEEAASVPPRVLPVTNVLMKDTNLFREYVADIQAVQNVELRARVQGFLERIYVDEGQAVRKGQILFKINDEEYRAELAKANANLESAIAEAKAVELEVDRLKVMVEKKVISETELSVAEAKLKAVNAKIEQSRWAKSNAQLRLSYTSIRSPFNGIIDRIPFKVGSLIDHGTLLTTVSDISEVFVYFNVSEGEYLEYVKSTVEESDGRNTLVSLMLADGTLYPFDGSVETMGGEFQASTGSISFRARFPNPNSILKHGATGKIRLSNTVTDAIMIPQKAAFEIQDKNFVFVVDSTNQVRMRNFVPKTRFSHYYIVESGLKSGEKIVFEGIQEIRDGMRIIPKPVRLDSLMVML